MSSENVDHAAEALRVWKDGIERGHPEARDNVVHESLLRATLALVEQQRIANVFYLARESHADIMDGLDALGVSADDIKKVLGL